MGWVGEMQMFGDDDGMGSDGVMETIGSFQTRIEQEFGIVRFEIG